MEIENYTLKELETLIKDGKKYRLFKPFIYNNQILINIEKVLTSKDVFKLDGKIFGQIQVLRAVEHDTDEKIRKAIIMNAVNILKTSTRFKVSETQHLDFNKRKECEKLLSSIIDSMPHLVQQLLKIYQFSKKLFIHSIHVGIISTIIDLGIQEKRKHSDGLRSEELLVGSLLHSVGMLLLPKILLEKRKIEYSKEEQDLYKNYPEYGRKIVNDLHDNIRKRSITIIHQHQEKLDGTGYPEELKGKSIDELALIVGLACEFELLMANETSATQKSSSEIMSRIARLGHVYGKEAVDSLYIWFRYLK
jgi:HD-GYP domain-containing protein (c-di-GMP phosphodiesterase class II)